MAESGNGPQHTPKSNQTKGNASGSKDTPKPEWTKKSVKSGTDQYSPTYQVGKGVGK